MNIIYIKIKRDDYNILEINEVFKQNNFIPIYISAFDNLKSNTYLLIGNNEREILPHLNKLVKNHKIIIVKNTFCYDTIPTKVTIQYFENIDTNKIMYFDSGIFYNNIYDYQNIWKNNKINYKMFKHSILKVTPHSNNILNYEDFCNRNNLNPSYKLATFFLNSCISIWDKRNVLKTDNIDQKGDRFVLENFTKLKGIFNKLGYNLIVKEHRDKWKQSKVYLDYVKKHGIPKNNFCKNENLPKNFKLIFDNYLKPHLKIFSEMYDSICDNSFEKEILHYSDVAIIGSCTSIGNILYSYDIKSLYIDSKNGSWVKGMSKRLNIDFKSLLYGIYVYKNDIINNEEKYIREIINYNKKFKLRHDHPFYGDAFITNGEYFNKLIKCVKKDNIKNTNNYMDEKKTQVYINHEKYWGSFIEYVNESNESLMDIWWNIFKKEIKFHKSKYVIKNGIRYNNVITKEDFMEWYRFVMNPIINLVTQETDCIIEFGSGWGRNIFYLNEQINRDDIDYYAFEYTPKGCEMTELLKEKCSNGKNISTGVFDFNNPEFSLKKKYKNIVIFTRHAIEQVKVINPHFFKKLQDLNCEYTVVHQEPVGWQIGNKYRKQLKYTNKILSEHKNEEYNTNLFATLKGLEQRKEINITNIMIDHSSFKHEWNSSTVIIWKPL